MSTPSSPRFCAYCGAALRPQVKFCSHCGHIQVSYTGATRTGFLVADHLLKQRYRIRQRLGQGGMGAVYQAEDTLQHDQRAVKEMSQSGMNPKELQEAAKAFEQEATLLSQLRHPQLPRIYDYFEEAGRWYLVMDFIVGETLEARLERTPDARLPLEEALDIGIKLCTVLGYLHTHEPPIVFRDLKPANVMLTPEGHVYLIDFGTARLFKPGKAKDTVLLGSPGYAAPEQYGKAQTTALTDIYSLGATLHQLLSGRDPTQNPFQFAPLGLGTQESAIALEQFIMRMVDQNRDKRPASVDEVKQELQRLKDAQFPSSATSAPQPIVSAALRQPIGTLLATFQGHTDAVAAVAWASDGSRLASASADRTVRLWAAASGTPLTTCQGHTQRVYSVAWSPDGSRLASAGADRTVRLWEATSGALLITCQGHAQRVYGVAWSPDNRRIASAGMDSTVRLWDAASGTLLAICQGHTDAVSAVAWSPDGSRLASASADQTVRVWDAASRKPLITCQGHTAGFHTVAWSPDGSRLASGGGDRSVHVWDAASGKPLAAYQGHTGAVRSIAWSPDGSRLASSGEDETVRLWNATGGRLIFTYRGHPDVVYAIAWSPDSSHIASASGDKLVQAWSA